MEVVDGYQPLAVVSVVLDDSVRASGSSSATNETHQVLLHARMDIGGSRPLDAIIPMLSLYQHLAIVFEGDPFVDPD